MGPGGSPLGLVRRTATSASSGAARRYLSPVVAFVPPRPPCGPPRPRPASLLPPAAGPDPAACLRSRSGRPPGRVAPRRAPAPRRSSRAGPKLLAKPKRASEAFHGPIYPKPGDPTPVRGLRLVWFVAYQVLHAGIARTLRAKLLARQCTRICPPIMILNGDPLMHLKTLHNQGFSITSIDPARSSLLAGRGRPGTTTWHKWVNPGPARGLHRRAGTCRLRQPQGEREREGSRLDRARRATGGSAGLGRRRPELRPRHPAVGARRLVLDRRR